MQSNIPKVIALVSLLAIAGCSITPHVSGTVLTKKEDAIQARRVPANVFSAADSVVCYVYFQWDEVTKEAGVHELAWRWYQDDKLVSQGEKRLHFKRTPYTTWTQRSAGSLGIGHFSVATVLDGTEVSRTNFEIRP
jgi:hypothetical protein